MFNIDVKFKATDQSFKIKFRQVVTHVADSVTRYNGDYEVTPKIVAQSLPTAETYLEQDVHIKSIPFFEVSNTSGGNTIFIGNEV